MHFDMGVQMDERLEKLAAALKDIPYTFLFKITLD